MKSSFLTLKQYLSDMPLGVTSTGDIYGGSLRIPKGSLFYTMVLLSNGIDITDVNKSMEYISSNEGSKKVNREFRTLYYKPLKKWFKNRKINNNKLFFFMLVHMTIYDNYLRDMAETAINPEEVIKFFKANNMY